MQILKGHLITKPIRSLAFSPDGTKLASAALRSWTILWDLTAGGHEVIEPDDSHAVAFSPDGSVIVIARWMGMTVWDVARKSRRRLEGDKYRIGFGRLAFLPDGTRLAAAMHSLYFWDLATFKPVAPRLKVNDVSGCLAFSRDGSTLATGHHDNAVRLWDAKTWKLLQTFTGPTTDVDVVSVSPDSRNVAAGAGKTLWVWETASGEAIVRHASGNYHYRDLSFSPDGRLLGFARKDGSVCFWSTAGWNEAAAYDFKVGAMTSFAFAPDGMRAAGGSEKGKVVVFDVDL